MMLLSKQAAAISPAFQTEVAYLVLANPDLVAVACPWYVLVLPLTLHGLTNGSNCGQEEEDVDLEIHFASLL